MSAFVRAAASSTASGMSSSRRQSSPIASFEGRPERRQNRSTASDPSSGSTSYSTSPCTRRSSREVTTNRRLGHDSTRPPRSGAASITCSMLSISRSISRSPMWLATSCPAPRTWPTVGTTSAGSRREASPTQKTPALNSPTSSAVDSIANLVFPDPPGPVRVTSRAPARTRATTSATSRSRPTKLDAGRGRFVFEIVFSGGNDSPPSWKIHTGSSKSLTRCSPRSRSSDVSTRSRVAFESSTCPPWPALMIRAARCTSIPTYFGGSSSGLPVCSPIRRRIGPSPSADCASCAAITPDRASWKATKNASPS